MVITRLKIGYFVDSNIFSCVLHNTHSPTVDGKSIALTFTRSKTDDMDAQRAHMTKVFEHHGIKADVTVPVPDAVEDEIDM
tara:strand:+ start:62 stop:304 length:243 start_codon:yes stop_codon:yes gene_type:complete